MSRRTIIAMAYASVFFGDYHDAHGTSNASAGASQSVKAVGITVTSLRLYRASPKR